MDPLGGPTNGLQEPAFPHSPRAGVTDAATTPGLYMGAEDLNSGLHACTVILYPLSHLSSPEIYPPLLLNKMVPACISPVWSKTLRCQQVPETSSSLQCDLHGFSSLVE
ncbi:hypothetical protein LEMLEM_LOCUS5222, partial [Lemmus lemmus]